MYRVDLHALTDSGKCGPEKASYLDIVMWKFNNFIGML